jgi:ribulose 1,5-bisphosphate synthetase/thiazole synthase
MTSLTRRDLIKQSSRAMVCMLVPFPIVKISNYNAMQSNNNFEVIIVGGSYAGLAAAMAMGRAYI